MGGGGGVIKGEDNKQNISFINQVDIKRDLFCLCYYIARIF